MSTTTERQALELLARRMREQQDAEDLDDALLDVWLELWPDGGQG